MRLGIPPPRAQYGLNLLELLIAIAVAVILLTVAVPNFRETTRQNRLSAQINRFVAALHLTQSEAVKRERAVTLCKSDNAQANTPSCSTTANWEQGWVIYVDLDNDGAIDTGEVIQRGAALRTPSSLRGSAAVANSVAYSATATMPAAGSFVLCDGGSINYARAVFLGTNGRIRQAPRNDGVPVNLVGMGTLTNTHCSAPP